MDLFHEGLTMFNMDVKSKRIAWVDNMYQKIEAICMDVDKNILLQGTTKYVESQVETVGINVRRFCAEVMQDLLPPSDDSIKGPISDLSLTYGDDVGRFCKSKVGLEELPPLNEKLPLPAELDGSVLMSNDIGPASSLDQSQAINDHEVYDNLTQKSNPVALEDMGHGCEDDKEIENKIVESGPVLLEGILPTKVIVSRVPLEARPSTETFDDVLEQHREPAVMEDILPQKGIGITGDSVGEEVEDFDVIDLSEKTIEFQPLENEKSYIDVESKAFCVISHPAVQTKSYKKKLKEAFISKLRSSKRKNHEELAYWYEDVDMETKIRGGISPSVVIRDPGSDKLSTLDPVEFEWELL